MFLPAAPVILGTWLIYEAPYDAYAYAFGTAAISFAAGVAAWWICARVSKKYWQKECRVLYRNRVLAWLLVNTWYGYVIHVLGFVCPSCKGAPMVDITPDTGSEALHTWECIDCKHTVPDMSHGTEGKDKVFVKFYFGMLSEQGVKYWKKGWKPGKDYDPPHPGASN